MSMAEIMTVIILFYILNQRDFKNFYKDYLACFHKKDFPTLLSYTRFLELMPRAVSPLSSYFKTLKSTASDICVIDSTSIKVCHNVRIPRHNTFAVVAERGRGVMGWYFGFKLHLVINHKGEIIAAKVTLKISMIQLLSKSSLKI
nr:transposase [Pseudoalteromonas sp. S2755]